MILDLVGIGESLITPPLAPLLILLIGIVWRKRMTLFFTLGILAMYFSSIGFIANLLMNRLEVFPVADAHFLNADAIVVLGAGLYRDAPEYGQDTLANLVLERVRYAAWLQKRTGLPILVSGGLADEHRSSQAEAMKLVLEEEFAATVKWTEDRSRNTFENGRNSADLLNKHGIQKIALVTHAYHMPRAVQVFQHHSMTVTPSPTVFFGRSDGKMKISDWVPSSNAMYRNRLALHEIIGLWYYKIRYFDRNYSAHP